jgi:tRNA threonylcarbamoyladenosine modification (KEOPS) complex  Pcc1 subunit
VFSHGAPDGALTLSISTLRAAKKKKAEKVIQPVEQKAAAATEEGKVIYKTITRDVVKYVQSQNRTVCRFDDDAVQLRQRAIDAANAIPGFDEPTVQGK